MAGADGAELRMTAWRAALDGGSFEEVVAALEQVVSRLEIGQLPLAESVDCFELGVRLAERCDCLLDEAELRVSSLEAVAERRDGRAGGDDPFGS